MNRFTLLLTASLLSSIVGFSFHELLSQNNSSQDHTPFKTPTEMTDLKLGAFSISLSVKNLDESRQFYETLGFKVFGGSMEQNYLIMKNENALIGLFQGMFEGNILTFNPGWDENAENMDEFDDVRDIQKTLESNGIKLTSKADETTSGPASIVLSDPDGNVILIDQHR
jgi:catechol 2,3-dioxygenase-like lactoylglutathione lyase family enzyme